MVFLMVTDEVMMMDPRGYYHYCGDPGIFCRDSIQELGNIPDLTQLTATLLVIIFVASYQIAVAIVYTEGPAYAIRFGTDYTENTNNYVSELKELPNSYSWT